MATWFNRMGSSVCRPGMWIVAGASVLLALFAGCKSEECGRTADCPVGEWCQNGTCVTLDTAPHPDGDGDVRNDEGVSDVPVDSPIDGEDPGTPDVGDDGTPPVDVPDGDGGLPECTDTACDAFCGSIGLAPGSCVEGTCACGGTPDAGDTLPPDDDAGDGDAGDVWECVDDSTCLDDNPCTFDACSPVTHACVHVALDGAECSDGLFCNGMETCSSGLCVPGIDGPCGSPDLQCQTVTCDESTDSCVRVDRPEDTPCDDGSYCNGADLCRGGYCLHPGPYPCPMGSSDPCRYSSCDDGTDTCITEPRPDGSLCNDELYCNGQEACLSGVCQPGTNPCNDGNPCTTDACAEGESEALCTYTPISGC
jgi:hypothetical protein